MNSFLIYLAESGICIGIFYLTYLFLMRRDTFFSINRSYILFCLIVSLIIPLLNISTISGETNVETTAIINTITVEAGNIENTVSNSIDFWGIILVIYLTGVVIFLIRFAIRLIQIFNLIRKSKISRIDGYKIVFTDDKYSPFSFFNLIFLGSSFMYNSDTELILAHEKVHIDKHHSIDIIIAELITILQWFNPFIWLLKKSL